MNDGEILYVQCNAICANHLSESCWEDLFRSEKVARTESNGHRARQHGLPFLKMWRLLTRSNEFFRINFLKLHYTCILALANGILFESEPRLFSSFVGIFYLNSLFPLIPLIYCSEESEQFIHLQIDFQGLFISLGLHIELIPFARQ